MSADTDQMKMTSPDSLFSLEVVVEKLAVPAVVCRFPAVAFRLLDFPTLLVYHVEPDLAENIKKKINSDPYYKVPPQLQELKDKSGYFILKKGKSCLFKVSPEMLQAHLMNTPLYVMLIDTYPKVPKLLGNCAIPLDEVMARIGDDINQNGISTPSAHGERGDFKVYNLMGFEIGSITLGFRLLSLGMGLIPHIPDNTISVYEDTSNIAHTSNMPPKPIQIPMRKPPISSLDQSETVEDIVENIVQSIQSADKNTQVAVSEFLPTMEHIDCQTDRETTYFRSSGNQTDVQRQNKKRSRHRNKDTADADTFAAVQNEMSDFFVTNMACPPPMYYNSQADDIHVYNHTLHQGLTFNEDGLLGVQTPHPNYAWGEGTHTTEMSSTCSEDTIRHQDVFSDSDIEEDVDFKSKRVIYNESKKAAAKKKKVQARKMTENQLANQTANVVQDMGQMANMNLQQLPLLNALLKEIMALQGVSLPHAAQIATTTTTSSRSTSALSRQTPRDKVDREEHLKKLATPRSGAKHPHSVGSPHKVCASHPEQVPKDKSWVRKDPDTAKPVPKTKLSYGMTNAQRLRLAKINPALLEKLEKKDQVRVEKSKERTKEKYKHYQHEMQIGERLMHSARSSAGQRSHRLALDTGASMDSTNGLSEASKSHRKPIPTPRRSLSMKHEEMKEVLMKIMEKDQLLGSEPGSKGSTSKNSNKDKKEEPLVIDLHDVNDTLEDVGLDKHDMEQMTEEPRVPPLNRVPEFGRTKTLYDPGFPTDPQSGRESRISRNESRLTDYGQYSEDFENEQENSIANVYSSAEEPSLKRFVENHSDESDDFGDEPMLRKVVDVYSSDESQSSFRTAASHDSHISHSRQTGSHVTTSHKTTSVLLNIASMPNPRASIHSPVAAIRPHIPLTGEGLAASSTPTESDMGTQPSTAFIRESQMPTLSDTGGSYDPVQSLGGSYDPVQSFDEQNKSADVRPRPSPRAIRRLNRISSIHTESVSSYAPSDQEDNMVSEGGESENNYTQSFDEDSDSQSGPGPVKQMSELKLAPENRMGYTWGGY